MTRYVELLTVVISGLQSLMLPMLKLYATGEVRGRSATYSSFWKLSLSGLSKSYRVLSGTGHEPVGKVGVTGAKIRMTSEVATWCVKHTDSKTLQGSVKETAILTVKAYVDEATIYTGLCNHNHGAVKHNNVSGYIREQERTNGIAPFWSVFKHGYVRGVSHQLSEKHLERDITEFCDTLEQMEGIARGLDGKRLCYHELNSDNGLVSGARG